MYQCKLFTETLDAELTHPLALTVGGTRRKTAGKFAALRGPRNLAPFDVRASVVRFHIFTRVPLPTAMLLEAGVAVFADD